LAAIGHGWLRGLADLLLSPEAYELGREFLAVVYVSAEPEFSADDPGVR
jgi:hypothetical protein